MKALTGVLAAILPIVAIGCGGANSPKSTQLTIGHVGDRWDMMNPANGHLTHFELLAVNQQIGCEAGEQIDLHIWKDNPEDYWAPGVAGATDHWVMRHMPNGDWRAVASLAYSDDGGEPATIDYVADPYRYLKKTSNRMGNDPGSAYLVLPGSYTKPVTRYGSAQWWIDYTKQTDACLQNIGVRGPDTPWTAVLNMGNVAVQTVTMQTVNTPFYQGLALANDEYEGCHPWDLKTCGSSGAAHEIWYFAPGVGLVEINAIWEGVTIKRIN